MPLRLALSAILALALSVSIRAGEIHLAVDRGDSVAVKSILDRQPDDLNARDSLGMTPLNQAAFKGHIYLVRMLLDRGADFRIGDKDSSLPIHNAAVAGQTGSIALLIDKGSDINAQDRNGETALLFASSYRKFETAAWLIEKGANVNLANLRQETPLQTAAMSDNMELARLLIEHGATTELPDSYGRTPLLLVARERGNAEMATFLLDHGANINARDRFGDTPLSLAAWRGFRSLCDLFLAHGAALPSTAEARKQMISSCAERGLANLFRALVDSIDVASETSGSNGTLLHETAKGGSGELCALLINKGLHVDDKDCWSRTPLHYAAERGRTEACSLLISKGADIDVQSRAGHTPLSLAVEFRKDTTAALLRKLGAKIEQPNFPRLQGPYFGQKPPGDQPEQFALDIVSSSRFKHGSITFSPDGLEAYWSSEYTFNDSGYSVGGTLVSRIENGAWTVPKLAEYSTVGNGDDVPFFSPDGNRLYFLSRRSSTPGGRRGAERIWYMDRAADGWSAPHLINGGPNSHGLHWQFSAAANGNIYFSSSDPRGLGNGDIWISRYKNGSWQTPEHLGAVVNSPRMEMCPFIAPDERYLIVITSDSGSSGNMYPEIAFRKPDGAWTEPKPIKSADGRAISGICPIVSSDENYLFLNSSQNGAMDIYWVDATVIKTMRKEKLK